MTYELAIGDRTYSSWSLRGWLFFEKFGLPVRTRTARLYTDEVQKLLADFAPARLLPAIKIPEGEVIGESIAILETLAERHPDAGHWPADPAARAMARYMVAEMHAGFRDLRGECPMNLAKSFAGRPVSDAVRADLARLETIWSRARARFGTGGPWLFGTYSGADAFFAPVAARIATYDLPVGPEARDYVAAHLADPAFRRWRAMGLAQNFEQPSYIPYYGKVERPWPGPAPMVAVAAEGPSQNAACPYSGRPSTHFLRLNGKVWGLCNAFCRDKTLHDPEAWPAFMEMIAKA